MRISFITPGYIWGPSGGIRVVYEYANRLATRGHEVNVVHPRKLRYPPPQTARTPYRWLREAMVDSYSRIRRPSISWQHVDSRVNVLFVPDSSARHIPDADAIFATGWHTVRSVLACSQSKGEKCYLIQGYEVWQGPKELVDATWNAPMHKVVIAKWLLDLGAELGCKELTYVPNAVDHERYRLVHPIEGRGRQVAMLFSPSAIKGSADGIEALKIAKEKHPDLKAVLFSSSRRMPFVPAWVDYYRDPPQDFLIKEIYCRSQIFLAPSWTEGSPLPPVEAACCGCALVATDIAGFREYIENGVTGLLSPPKDPVKLAENICTLLENRELRLCLARTGLSAVRQLNWERSTDMLESFLMRVAPVELARIQAL